MSDGILQAELQVYEEIAWRCQTLPGGWSHGVPGGYGEVNANGINMLTGLAMMRQCGLDVDEGKLAKTIRYFGRWVGGHIPYGNHAGGGAGGNDNGSSGKAALAFMALGV